MQKPFRALSAEVPIPVLVAIVQISKHQRFDRKSGKSGKRESRKRRIPPSPFVFLIQRSSAPISGLLGCL